MARRGLGKLMALAAVAGAAAASVSYVLQYKMFHKELDKDFREYEEDAPEEEAKEQEPSAPDSRSINRNYISLSSSKDEFKVAARDMAHATRNVLKDAGNILSDTAREAVSAAVDTAHIAVSTVKAKKDEYQEAAKADASEDSEFFEDDGFLDDDYVDEDDLFDYEQLDSPAPHRRKEDAAASEAPKPKEAHLTVDSTAETADEDLVDVPIGETDETPAPEAKAAEDSASSKTATIEDDTTA